jgi:hypothetical protein
MLIFFFPAGVFWCFSELRDEHVFVIIYAVLSSYFAGVMVRVSQSKNSLMSANAGHHSGRLRHCCHGVLTPS